MTRRPIRLASHRLHLQPILSRTSRGAEDNLYGFEGGRVLEDQGKTHLFTTEVYGRPKFIETRLAHWVSQDQGLTFERVGTVLNPAPEATPPLHYRSPWTPYPVYNEEEEHWNLFFVGYYQEEQTGKILRAVSQTHGRSGLAGPYKVTDVAMERGAHPDPWEGKCVGVVSFFPYKVGAQWYAFYGSNNITSHSANTDWRVWTYSVGLAVSQRLSGGYQRCTELNPVQMDPKFIENPVVQEIDDSGWLAFYDGSTEKGIAYSWSADGIHWNPESVLYLPAPIPDWIHIMRTPLGLIRLSETHWRLFFTAFDGDHLPVEAVGFGTLGAVDVTLESVRE